MSNGRGRGNGGADTDRDSLSACGDISKATVFILCTYTSIKTVYKTMDIPLIPSSRSPLLSSPDLLSSHSISAEAGQRCPLPEPARTSTRRRRHAPPRLYYK
jgi:hypothetical protein